MLLPVVLSTLLFLCGLLLWRLGCRGRVINDHPVCTACLFDLVGVYPASQVCPECGRSLDQPDSITQGVRRSSPRLVWTGIVVAALSLIFGLGWGITAAGGTGVNRYLPTPILITKAKRAQGVYAAPVLTELERRFTAGTLHSSQVDQIVDATLDVQAKRNSYEWHTAWGDLFDSIAAAGHVSGDNYATYVRQALSLTPDARRRIHRGDAVPLRLSAQLDRAGAHTLWYLRQDLSEVTLDGRPTQPYGHGYSTSSLQHGSSGSSTSTYPLAAEIGTHQLKATWKVAVTLSSGEDADRLAEWDLVLDTPIEIVDPSQPIVTLVRDPAKTTEFRENAKVQYLWAKKRDGGKTHVEICVQSDRRPLPAAMEAVLVLGQQSWSVGTFTFPKSNGTWSTTLGADLEGFEAALASAGLNFGPSASAQSGAQADAPAQTAAAGTTAPVNAPAFILELRPSISAARRSVGFDEILGETVSLPATIKWQE